MNTDNWLSIARSGLKIVGSALVTFGIMAAGQVDTFTTSAADLIGAGATLVGLFWSFWHHTPDEPAVTKQ